MLVSRAYGWGGDGTACALARLNRGEIAGDNRMGRGKGVRLSNARVRHVARETSELAYSWDSERAGKLEIDSDGNIAEQK